jgi:hypothetical protein
MLVLIIALLAVILLLAIDDAKMRMAQDNSANDNVQKRYEQRNQAARIVASQPMRMVNDLAGHGEKLGGFEVRPPKGVDTTSIKPASAPPTNSNAQ